MNQINKESSSLTPPQSSKTPPPIRPNWFARHKVLTVLIFGGAGSILIIASLSSAVSESAESRRMGEELFEEIINAPSEPVINGTLETKKEEPEEPKEEVEVIKVSALDLYDAYDANEVAADNKYRSKILEITGTVEEIGKNFLDQSTLRFVGDGYFSGVKCTFRKEHDAGLASLREGQTVTVRGIGEGEEISDVEVGNCRLVT